MKDYCAENEKNASDIFGSAFLTVPLLYLDQLLVKICRSGKEDGYICFYLPAVFMQMGMLD